jgi:hypothetical protein
MMKNRKKITNDITGQMAMLSISLRTSLYIFLVVSYSNARPPACRQARPDPRRGTSTALAPEWGNFHRTAPEGGNLHRAWALVLFSSALLPLFIILLLYYQLLIVNCSWSILFLCHFNVFSQSL